MRKAPKTVTLKLNYNQAAMLETLLSNTGGSPTNSARKYADEVNDMLHDRGVFSEFEVSKVVNFHFADFKNSGSE